MSGIPLLVATRMKHTVLSLLPSFIQYRIDASRKPATKEIFPTSYLDGLRGLAALFVFWYHTYGTFLPTLMPSYGLPLSSDGTRAFSSFLQLPILRVTFSGRPMVHIFFIISGYALSLKSLKQIRSNNKAALLGTISSALFRRGIRLFLPLVASTFIGAVLLQMNFRVGAAPTFSAQMWEWYSELSQIINFWNPDGRAWITLDPHLWTIPVEMSNSVILFACLIAMARCKVALRMITLVGAIIMCMRVGHWVASEFLMGMFLAEFGLIQDDLNQYLGPPEVIDVGIRRRQLHHARRIGSIVLKGVCILNLILALWLAGWPEAYPEQDSGFAWIMAHTGPPYHDSLDRMQFPWFGLAAFQIVFSCQQLPFLQSALTTPVIQYLGKISYSMYLMHWSLFKGLSPRIFPPIWKWIESISGNVVGPWGVTLIWLLTGLAITPVVLWAGDLFCIIVDDNCVAFAKWLEGKCIKGEDV
ncbi:acyltransferase [Stipitochalara longipes BDJ]|nr:acyltransferase [Stipitochalara longipes BDJ]